MHFRWFRLHSVLLRSVMDTLPGVKSGVGVLWSQPVLDICASLLKTDAMILCVLELEMFDPEGRFTVEFELETHQSLRIPTHTRPHEDTFTSCV